MDYASPDLATDSIAPTLPFGSTSINNLLAPTNQPVAAFGSDDFDTFSKAVSRRAVRLSTRGSRQRLIGGAGNDVLDASRGRGRNFLKGKGGNDRLLAGLSDRLFGDAGNDTLDARRGRGGNTLSGGAGNDILWAGAGGNQLIGGQGVDQFWIADRTLPTSINTIRDFQLGIDVIGVNAIPGVTYFSDLTLAQQGADTLISVQGRAIALLSGITVSSLTAQNFVGLQTQNPPPPPLPTLSTSNISVSERDTGITTAAVEVRLSAASATPVTVNYQTIAGTATPDDADYAPVSGTLTFAPGETTKAIAISIVNDTRDEFDETLNVVLSNPTNATLANGQAIVTILDNDTTNLTASSTQSDGSKTNSFSLVYDFDLYDITPTGDYRRDEDGNITNTVGIFSGAIENFTALYSTTEDYAPIRFTSLSIGRENNFVELTIPEKLTLDLRATFIPRGSTFSLPNGTTRVATQDQVEYQLTSNRLRNETGIFEWTLILSDGLFEESVIDPIKAVNSIEYIIANQLLERSDEIRLSITLKNNPQEFHIEDDVIEPSNSSNNNEPLSPRVVSRTTPPAIPRPTPYNNTIAPTNDTLTNAIDTRLSSSGSREFFFSTEIGVIPDDFSDPDPSKDVDFYKVQLNAGEVITIDINSSFSLDSILRVVDANGTQLAFSDNDAAPGESLAEDSYIQFQAITTGTYYIGVSGANNTSYNPLIANSGTTGDGGTYALSIELREPNNTIATAIDTRIIATFDFESYFNRTQIGDNPGNFPASDVDFYKVQLAAGDLLEIDIDTYNFLSSTNTDRLDDSYVRVFNTNGVQLTFSDDDAAPDEDEFSGFRDSYLEYIVTTTGVYYIGVSSYGNRFYDPVTGANTADGSTGFYELTIRRSP